MQYHQPPPHIGLFVFLAFAPQLISRPSFIFQPSFLAVPLLGALRPLKKRAISCTFLSVNLSSHLFLSSCFQRPLAVYMWLFMAAIFRTRVNVCPRFDYPPRPEQSVFVPWAHHIKSQNSPRRRLVVPSHACPPHKESSYVPSPLPPARFPGLNPTRAHHHHLLCGEGENHERLRFRLLAWRWYCALVPTSSPRGKKTKGRERRNCHPNRKL